MSKKLDIYILFIDSITVIWLLFNIKKIITYIYIYMIKWSIVYKCVLCEIYKYYIGFKKKLYIYIGVGF